MACLTKPGTQGCVRTQDFPQEELQCHIQVK